MTTLLDYFQAAGVTDDMGFAKHIELIDDYGEPLNPFKHQVTGLNGALANLRYGLFDEPGCGKTLPAQALGIYYVHFGNKVLVLMPPVLLRQFRTSFFHTFQGIDAHVSIHILDEPPKKREDLYKKWDNTGWPQFMLMTYQMFLKEDEAMQKAGYNVLICDEAHALKNPSSKSHKKVARFIGSEKDAKAALLLMTGTPAPNTLTDLYGIIRLLNPSKYSSMKSFERTHCIYVQEGDWLKLVGYRNKDMLSINLYSRARRVRKDDVFSREKPVIQEIPVELHEPHRKLYEQLVRDRILELDGGLVTALNAQSLRMKLLRMAANPEYFTGKTVKNSVMEEVDQLLDTLGAEHKEKVILFAHFQSTVEALADRYKHLNPAVIYGGTKDREAEREKFLEDETCRLAIMQPKSGGVGLNFQHVCRYVIFVEPTSVPGDFKQASERVDRPGQKHVVGIYVLRVLGTSSPRLIDNMLQKERDSKSVMLDKQSMMDDLLDRNANV